MLSVAKRDKAFPFHGKTGIDAVFDTSGNTVRNDACRWFEILAMSDAISFSKDGFFFARSNGSFNIISN